MVKSIVFKFIILITLCIQSVGFSQSITLIGNVKSTQGEFIDIADVLLTTAETSEIVKFTSVTAGKFKLVVPKSGTYILSIYSLGYKSLEQKLEMKEDKTIDITLEEEVYSLEEVTIISERKTIVIKNGSIKVNIQESPLAAIPNSIDLIAALPTITVSPNRERISIVGKGEPLIYLDNRRISVDQFYGVSVDDIKSIEIIDNPSSKYEADGRALILIQTNKKKLEGAKVSLSETASFKTFFNNYFSVNTQFKKNKFELKANVGFNALQPREHIQSRLEIPLFDLTAENMVTADGDKPELRLGGSLFYELNDDDYLSLDMNSYFFDDQSDIFGNGITKESTVENVSNTLNDSDDQRDFLNGSFNFNKKIKKANLFFGIQYTHFNRELNALVRLSKNRADFSPFESRNQTLNTNALSGRIDFEKQLKKALKLEMGINVNTSNSRTTQIINNLTTGITVSNTDYNYEEEVYATYGELSGKLSKNMYFSTGLRIENYLAEGGFNGESLLVKRNQTNFFPKANFNLKLDSLSSLQVNYARSIKRPNFTELTQVSVFVSPFLVFENNLNLSPSLTNEITLSFFRQKKSIALTYFERVNPISSATFFDEESGIFTYKPSNFDKETGLSLKLIYPIAFTNFWSASSTVSLNYLKIDDRIIQTNSTSPFLYYFSRHQFKLPGKISLALTGWGYTERNTGLNQKNAIFVMNMSASKTFFKKYNFTVGFNDIFRNMNFRDFAVLNGVSSTTNFIVDAREIFFSLKYSFGNIGKMSFKNKKANNDDKRIR
jgi:hypothetical protein